MKISVNGIFHFFWMKIGEGMVRLGKDKGMSIKVFGKKVGTSGDVIGRYERGDISPSVEVVIKIADALEVSVDCLIGKTDVEMDKDIKKRILEVSKFNDEDRASLYSVIDAFIAKRKIQSIL